ncbi:MAG: FtsW/RodA/SpoVE family cell cycle protein [Rikenellaceae bacterium]
MTLSQSKYSIANLRRLAKVRASAQSVPPPSSWFKGDRVLWIIIAVLSVISILVVYSSTAKMAYNDSAIRSTTQFLQQQIGALLIGAGLIMAIAHLFKSQFFMAIAPVVFYLSLLLTGLAYLTGMSTNGAARWLPIGGFQFQPSEALKVATIMYLARVLAVRQNVIHKLRLIPTYNITKWSTPKQKKILKEGFFPVVFPMLLACAIVIPAHTSSAVLLFVSSLVVMAIGRIKYVELGKLVLFVGLAASIFFIGGAGRSDTAGGRLSTWVELWTGDRSNIPVEELSDTERSMAAIHHGGAMGVGPGRSVMRVELIHPESDYAFALFVEEYGAIIAVALMMLYIWIFFRAITIFKKCGTTFPALLVLGLGMMITCQALLHIAVSVNLIPETGQTLPLISRGGSALIFNAIALGMILSVSRQNDERSHDMPRSQSIWE